MHLELLPNEILFDLFAYMNGTDLFHTFYGLNSRFNFLLCKQVRSYHFDFEFVSKSTFDLICQQHLPLITDRVISLGLSNYKTVGQCDLFISYIPSFRQLTCLRSVTIFKLCSSEVFIKLLNKCHQLDSLTCLNVKDCHFPTEQADFSSIIDKIWSLPKLTDCHFHNIIRTPYYFNVPTIISTSLECVTIFHSDISSNHINLLFDCTPRLKRLSTYVMNLSNNNYIISPHLKLIQLNMCFASRIDASEMAYLLQSMPNLRHLNINTRSNIIDGYQWEHILRNYLSKLKTFRLKMKWYPRDKRNIQEEAENLLDSFRSSFWIDEQQWFVRCFIGEYVISLSTLSSKPEEYETVLGLCKYTCSDDANRKYDNSMAIIHNITFFNQPIPFNIRLSNITHLAIKFPINDKFWSVVPHLNALKTLILSFYDDTMESELQALLDRAPYLTTLAIRQDASLPIQMALFKHTNASIRELDLENYVHYFNEKECLLLIRSSLGIQCQVLSIRVNNCENIVTLVKNMVNLRILYIYRSDEKYSNDTYLKTNNDGIFRKRDNINTDELIQWLKDQLPSTCVIVKDLHYVHNILIWI